MKLFIKHKDATNTDPYSKGEFLELGEVEVGPIGGGSVNKLWFKNPPPSHAFLKPFDDRGWCGYLCIDGQTSDIIYMPDESFGMYAVPEWVNDPLLRAIKIAEYREGKSNENTDK